MMEGGQRGYFGLLEENQMLRDELESLRARLAVYERAPRPPLNQEHSKLAASAKKRAEKKKKKRDKRRQTSKGALLCLSLTSCAFLQLVVSNLIQLMIQRRTSCIFKRCTAPAEKRWKWDFSLYKNCEQNLKDKETSHPLHLRWYSGTPTLSFVTLHYFLSLTPPLALHYNFPLLSLCYSFLV